MHKCKNLIKNAISEATNISTDEINDIVSQKRLLQIYELVDNEINKTKQNVGTVYENLLKEESILERDIEIFNERITHRYYEENINEIETNYIKKNSISDKLVERLYCVNDKNNLINKNVIIDDEQIILINNKINDNINEVNIVNKKINKITGYNA